MLDLGLDLNAWPWVWLVVAVAFALIELTVLAGSFVLLPMAVSAFAASLAGFYGAAVEVQWSIFFFGGGALWLGLYRYARRFMSGNELPPGVGADRLIGLVGVVTRDIDPTDAGRQGRVALDGETWPASSADGSTLTAGTRIRVIKLVGTRVTVEPTGDTGITGTSPS